MFEEFSSIHCQVLNTLVGKDWCCESVLVMVWMTILISHNYINGGWKIILK